MNNKEFYKENELEFLMLFRQFKQKIEDGSIMNDENASQFIEVLQSMADSLNDIVQLRRETNELDHIKQTHAQDSLGNCPVCLDIMQVEIVGEVESSDDYHVNLLKCKTCGSTFEDHLPNRDEEMLRWYENFFNHLTVAHEDGTYAESFEIPSEDLLAIREVYEELKRNRETIKASKKHLEEIEETSDQQLREVTQYLYMIYGQVVSGDIAHN